MANTDQISTITSTELVHNEVDDRATMSQKSSPLKSVGFSHDRGRRTVLVPQSAQDNHALTCGADHPLEAFHLCQYLQTRASRRRWSHSPDPRWLFEGLFDKGFGRYECGRFFRPAKLIEKMGQAE